MTSPNESTINVPINQKFILGWSDLFKIMHDNETEKCEALGACQIKNSLVLKQETKTQKE